MHGQPQNLIVFRILDGEGDSARFCAGEKVFLRKGIVRPHRWGMVISENGSRVIRPLDQIEALGSGLQVYTIVGRDHASHEPTTV